MRNRVGEKDDKVRVADLLFQASLAVGEDLALCPVRSTGIEVHPFHPTVPAYNDDTHNAASRKRSLRWPKWVGRGRLNDLRLNPWLLGGEVNGWSFRADAGYLPALIQRP